ncbi:MAG TPA: choice-of-anchor P family protein [Nocardioidaceae bacterium]|nr:choice-of-anchor P family protein [Nocardioidaceae bacterium]
MRRPIRHWVMVCLAAGLVGTAAPVPLAHAEPAFGGYSTEATATPLKIEIYEPVIPIPASPQAELEIAYTKVEAASGPTGRGLASWLWPGDPIGQGCKTFVEQLGLGDTGLCADGYPVQVNSRTPGEQSEQSDEPFPGSLMRTSADRKGVRSTVGWSSDRDVSEKMNRGGEEPELPDNPLDQLGSLGAAITGQDRTSSAEPEPGDGLPPELAVLVDVDGMVSKARTETVGKSVNAVATSKLTNLSLLGGIITADSVSVTTRTSADGKRPTASGVSKVVGLELAGTPIEVGRDGVRLADESHEIPQMPDDPEKALKQLGVSLVLPKPERTARGDSSSAEFEGVQIVIDAGPLRRHLDDVPFEDVLGLIPDQAEELRNLLGAATQLAPRFVITAGNAAAETTTVPKMELDLPSVDAGDLNGAAVPPASSGSAGGLSTGSAGGAPVDSGAVDAAGAAGGESGKVDALAAEPMSAGLPPLASIPGALMVGAFVIAAGIGWWLQKIGGLVLGGAGSCSHGLETGVPDLRRA